MMKDLRSDLYTKYMVVENRHDINPGQFGRLPYAILCKKTKKKL